MKKTSKITVRSPNTKISNFNKKPKYFQTFHKHEGPEVAVTAALTALAGYRDRTGQDTPAQKHPQTCLCYQSKREEEAPHKENTELFLIRSFTSPRGRSTYDSGGLAPVIPERASTETPSKMEGELTPAFFETQMYPAQSASGVPGELRPGWPLRTSSPSAGAATGTAGDQTRGLAASRIPSGKTSAASWGLNESPSLPALSFLLPPRDF